jgi:hypothetical protein
MTTRAFFRGKVFGKERLAVFHVRGRTLASERGTLFGKTRTKSSRTFASPSDAARAFDAACAKLERDAWIEIRALIKQQYFEPPIGLSLDKKLQAALIATAKAKEDAPVVAAPLEDRIARLFELVTQKKRIRVSGKLHLTSGRFVAADPMLFGDAPPFERALPPGGYDVDLSVVDGYVAAATLRLSRAAPERWELALPRGMKRLVPEKLRRPLATPGYGFPVDSATACFADASLGDALDSERTVSRLLSERAMNRCHALGKDGATIAVFRSGRGDGTYGTYFGLRSRDIVCVTIDFGL